MGALPHGLDRYLVADGTRDDDEGEVLAALVEDLQGPEAVPRRQAVVAHHGVPLLCLKRRSHRLFGEDLASHYGHARVLKRLDDEDCVVLVVFHQQDADGASDLVRLEIAEMNSVKAHWRSRS